jgi:hypothetical protein
MLVSKDPHTPPPLHHNLHDSLISQRYNHPSNLHLLSDHRNQPHTSTKPSSSAIMANANANNNQAVMNYELYRRSSIGHALVDCLDSLIQENRIEPQAALTMLLHFDREIAGVLSERVKSRLTFRVCIGHSHLIWMIVNRWKGSSGHLPILR